jgi:elongation factor G
MRHRQQRQNDLDEAMLYGGPCGPPWQVKTARHHRYDPEEIKRHISISAAIAPVEWKNTKINVIDVPGYFDFIGEMMGPLRVVETAGIVVGAVSGLDVGAEKAWNYAKKNDVCRMFIINRMDAENANYMKVVEQLRDKFGSSVVPMLLPMGEGVNFKGVVNVLENKAYEGTGKGLKEVAVPGDMASAIETAMEEITEAAAGADDDLMMKYLEGEELTHEEILSGFRAGMQSGTIVPVVAVSAITGVGVAKMLDVMSVYLHSPKGSKAQGENPKNGEKIERACESTEPFSAFVYKTVADPFVGKLSLFRVMSGSITPATALYNSTADKPEKAGGLFIMRGKKQTSANVLNAGDLGALSKLQFTIPATPCATPLPPSSTRPSPSPLPAFPRPFPPPSRAKKTRCSPAWPVCRKKILPSKWKRTPKPPKPWFPVRAKCIWT